MLKPHVFSVGFLDGLSGITMDPPGDTRDPLRETQGTRLGLCRSAFTQSRVHERLLVEQGMCERQTIPACAFALCALCLLFWTQVFSWRIP